MKKSTKFTVIIGIILLMFLICFAFYSCTSCGGLKEEVKSVSFTSLVVEDIIKLDINKMSGRNFRWYETCILMNDFLDEETDGSIKEVVNVFLVVDTVKNGYDIQVYKFQHFSDGKVTSDSIMGIWVEDMPLVDSLINISYKKAFELIQSVNLPKPHTKNAVLRNPLGPISVNPQWVFGNIRSQIWLDATTGEIRESNPAFPVELKMPLGEWP